MSRDFTAGAIYENLVISTAFGGGHIYNVLAKTLTMSKDGKTLTISDPAERQVVGRHAD